MKAQRPADDRKLSQNAAQKLKRLSFLSIKTIYLPALFYRLKYIAAQNLELKRFYNPQSNPFHKVLNLPSSKNV